MNLDTSEKRVESAVDAMALDVSATDSSFPKVARAILVGTSGDLDVTTLAGNRVTLLAVPAGVLPLCVRTVHTANTTATNIAVLF